MDKQRNLSRVHPSLREFCSEAFTGAATSAHYWSRHSRTLPPSSSSAPFSSWTSYKMKNRRSSQYNHRTGRHRMPGGSWAFSDSRGHYVHRQSSEDSGFSSCGSSASSIADDSEIAGYPVLSAYKSSLVSSNEKKVPAYRCSPNSGTVASVLAAGISSDFEESDEEGGRDVPYQRTELHHNLKENFQSNLKTKCMDVPPSLYPEDLQVMHTGRNILDLGGNLLTQFPMQASKLPERNVPLYLLNRSQYHRLGKFGTSETLLYVNCKNVCGFAYPVPPN